MEKTSVMQNQSYYRTPGERENDRRVDDLALAVNCAGLYAGERSFSSENPHGRKDFYLQYVVEGELSCELAGAPTLLRAGDAVIRAPHTRYAYSGTPETVYYWVHFSGSEAFVTLSQCALELGVPLRVGLHKRLTGGFERLFEDFLRRDELFDLSLSQTLARLLIDLSRLKASSSERRSDDRIDRVIARIHKSYASELSVASLAAEEFLSEGRLRVLFKERCGMSPRRYITALRIDSARELLEQPELSIAEIAAAVGIPDSLYFSRLFRDSVGVSPSEYRLGRRDSGSSRGDVR